MYDVEEPLYAIIPCFKSGVIYANKMHALMYEVVNIDIEGSSITLDLSDYTHFEGQPEGEWHPGVFGRITIHRGQKQSWNKEDLSIDSFDAKCVDFVKLYTSISPRKLSWSRSQVNIWENIILQNAVDHLEVMGKKGQNPLSNLALAFIGTVSLSNFFLSKYRPVMAKQPAFAEQGNGKGKKNKGDFVPLGKSIRNVGAIKFVSEKAPKRATEKTLCKYITEAWQVRGHVRHYKNGKTVYIKPAVHRRKSLAGAEKAAKAGQTVIRVTNNIPAADTERGQI